jgi:hypothetical protein
VAAWTKFGIQATKMAKRRASKTLIASPHRLKNRYEIFCTPSAIEFIAVRGHPPGTIVVTLRVTSNSTGFSITAMA